MKHPVHRLALVLAVSALSAALPADTIAFHPGESSVVSKHFRTDCELVMDDLRVSMNGQDADPSMLGIPADLSVSFGYLVECSDRYAAVADGRVTELLRTFESFEGWFVDPDGEKTSGEGDVDGHTVRFTWNDEDGEYERELVDDEDIDEEHLAVLSEDLDLRGLLPGEDVDEGDEWEVSGPTWMAVLLPGVDLQAALRTDEDVPAEVVDAVTRLIEGASATCSYAGTEEDEGSQFQAIDIACTIDEDVRLDPSALGASGAGMGEATFELGLELDVEGRCLWDPEAGRFHALSLEGYGTIDVEVTIDAEELGANLEGTAEFSLDFKREAGAE